MKTLLSILIVLATSNTALSANIPFGYSCTTDLRGICDNDRDAPTPSAAPSAPSPAAAAPSPAAAAPTAPSTPETTQPESEQTTQPETDG